MNTAVMAATPFEMVGGNTAVRRVVDRFYDLMDQEPRFAALRALHAADLTPMRQSLAGFLDAWLGGPRDWFEQRQGACVMSLHARMSITGETAEQWVSAMRQALAEEGVDADLGARIGDALARMAGGMVRS